MESVWWISEDKKKKECSCHHYTLVFVTCIECGQNWRDFPHPESSVAQVCSWICICVTQIPKKNSSQEMCKNGWWISADGVILIFPVSACQFYGEYDIIKIACTSLECELHMTFYDFSKVALCVGFLFLRKDVKDWLDLIPLKVLHPLSNLLYLFSTNMGGGGCIVEALTTVITKAFSFSVHPLLSQFLIVFVGRPRQVFISKVLVIEVQRRISAHDILQCSFY